MDDQVTRTRETLIAAREELRALAERHECGEALRDLGTARARLDATSFRLVVLGEYKRGKSTLVNALLGSNVLPMDVVPLTSVVTEVAYAPEPRTQVEFLDGRLTDISADALSSFVTEPENPRNTKAVKRAIVRLPSPLLKAGVTIVDTPGVGSIFEHNTEVTYEFLAESDAVVIVLAADQPLSAEERRLLTALAGITDHVLFAVNRVDVLAPEDAAKSVEFIRRNLKDLCDGSLKHVFPLSARTALETAGGPSPPAEFATFDTALRQLLIGRKSDLLENRARLLMRRAADLLTLKVGLERHALDQGQLELQRTLDRLESAAATARDVLDNSAILLSHDVHRLHAVTLRQALEATRQRLVAELWPRVESTLRAHGRRPLHEIVRELAVAIGEWVVADLKRSYSETEALAQNGLSRALEGHVKRVHAATGDVVALANNLLGMHAEVPRAVAPLDERARFYYKDWDYSGGPLRTPGWWFQLPRRWAEPRARQALHELLERRINQNLGAIRYDWLTRLDDAVRRFSTSSREQFDSIVGILSEGVKRAERLGTVVASDHRRDELERDLATLQGLRERLDDESQGRPIPARAGLG